MVSIKDYKKYYNKKMKGGVKKIPTKSKKKYGGTEHKKKREPTAYNLFVKEQMSIVKDEFPDLNRQDLMRKVGEMWKAQKKE